MAKNSIRDYDATSGNNTDVQSVDISEGCAASGINNALREIMTDLKNVSTGAVNLETPGADQLNVDNIRIDGNTISSTDTNGNVNIDPAGTGDTVIASGNVGIGVSSPVELNEAGFRELIIGGATEGAGITLKDADANVKLGMFCSDASNTGVLRTITNHPLAFRTNNTERMRIDSSGQVMIGTTTAGGQFTVTEGDATTIIDRVGTNVAGIKTGSGDDFCVGTADYTQAIRIKNNSGRIGINQTGPATTLDVNGTLTVTTTAGRGLTIKSAQGGTGQNDADAVYDAQDTEGGGGGFHKFFVGGNEKARIENDGDIKNVNNSYGAISDQRMKENIVDAASQWDDIKAVQVRKFNMIGSDTTQIGVIAQELEAANMSGLVSEAGFTDDKLNPDGELRKTVKYSVLYMKAIGALQEAIAKIETLETQRADLEARLTALENA